MIVSWPTNEIVMLLKVKSKQIVIDLNASKEKQNSTKNGGGRGLQQYSLISPKNEVLDWIKET